MQIKKIAAVMLVVLAVAVLLPLTVLAMSGVADDKPSSSEVLGPNLLTNPGMEGKYVKQCSLRDGPHWVQVPCPEDYNAEAGTYIQWETAQVPYGWSAWWRQPNNNFDDPDYFNTWPAYCPNWPSAPDDCIAHHNPEYRDTLGGPQDTGPSRKVAGDNSQKYFTFYSIHEAGLYQVIGGVKPGDRLRFSAWMEAWSSGANDPFESDFNQHMNLQVGIDPTGGNNPWSPNIIWTKPTDSFDKFTQFVVEAVAKNNVVSVWTRSAPELALQHVDVYVDEASLNVVQSSQPPAKPKTGTTKVITTTRVITNAKGITSTVIVTRTIVVTPTPTKPVTTTKSTKPVTATATAKPVTTTATTKPVSSTSAANAPDTYTVVQGDTLIAIARRFGITPWLRLAEINNLKEPYKIEVRQVLKLK